MKIKTPTEWMEVEQTASISFGPVQLYCYPDPRANVYRFKIGSNVSKHDYPTLRGAQNAGLRHMEKLGQVIVEGVRAMPEYETDVVLPDGKSKLDDWHLSILGMGKTE